MKWIARARVDERARKLGNVVVPEATARALGVVSFVALIALGAHVRFFLPGNPIPVTLQTLFVLLAGLILRPQDSAFAVIAYLALGASGAPLFALGEATGLAYFAGPTGGYLVAFVLAALLVGVISRKFRGSAGIASGLLAGETAILGLGVVHLCFVCGMDIHRAAAVGAAPFLVGDGLKLAAAFVTAEAVRGLRRTSAARREEDRNDENRPEERR